MRCEQEVRAVGLSNQAQAVKSDVLIELDVDERDAVLRATFPGGMAIQNLHESSVRRKKARPTGDGRQAVVVDVV